METAQPGGSVCTVAHLSCLRDNYAQQRLHEIEQLLQRHVTKEQQRHQVERRDNTKTHPWLQGCKQQPKTERRQQQQRREIADKGQQRAAQGQEEAVAAAQSACLAVSRLSVFDIRRGSGTHACWQTVDDCRRSGLVLQAAFAAEKPPAASAPVGEAVAVAAVSTGASPPAAAFLDPPAPADASVPTAAVVDSASPFPAAAVSTAAVASSGAGGHGSVAGMPVVNSTDRAWTVECSAACASSSNYLATRCMPVATLLKLLLPLLFVGGPLLLCSPMHAKAVSLGTLEKPRGLTSQPLLRRQTAAGELSQRALLCNTGRVLTRLPDLPAFASPARASAATRAETSAGVAARSFSLSASSHAASTSSTNAHLRRAAATFVAAQGTAATAPTADAAPFAAAGRGSAAAAAACRSLSAVCGEGAGRLVRAAAAPSAAGGSSLTGEAARATHLHAVVAFATSDWAAAPAPSKSRAGEPQRQQQQTIAAAAAPLSGAAFNRHLSACPASAAAAAWSAGAAAAAVTPAATLFPCAAASSASCSATAKPAAAAKPAASPFFTPRRSYSVAFHTPLCAASASPPATLTRGRSECAVPTGATRIAAATTTIPAPPAAGESAGRPAKTATAAAGSLRDAEYAGGSGGGRPRHWETSLNRVTLIGRVGAEPEIRQMTNGDKFAGFSVATSSHWVDKSTGELQARTEWHRVVVYDESMVDLVDKYLHTGRRVYVEGKLQTRRWTASDGAERYTTSVVVSRYQGELILLDQPAAAASVASFTDSAAPALPRDEGTELTTA